MPSSIHICLISGQLLPNLIPIMMQKPDEVHLVVSRDMIANGNRFEHLLNAHGFRCITHGDAPSTGLVNLRPYAEDLLWKLDAIADGRKLVLNATGGTKLMALAFYEVFRQSDAEILYTDTEHNRLEFLSDRDHPVAPITGVLDVSSYLAAYGLTLRHSSSQEDTPWHEQVLARKPTTKWLAKEAGKMGDFLGALNELVQSALSTTGDELVEPEQRLNSSPRGRWRKALETLSEANLIQWSGGLEIVFLDIDRTRYLGGGWLEEYAWHVISDEHPDDCKANVVSTWDKSGGRAPRNEFDLLAVHCNRMLVVECKTSRFGRDQSHDSDLLYKLESLGSNAGGLFGKMLLLSARTLSDDARARATSQHIGILDAGQVGQLRDYVRQWMGIQQQAKT